MPPLFSATCLEKILVSLISNNTGRPVILTSRLELYRLTHQSWSTSRLILPGDTQVWRFLGDTAPVPVMAFLSLLPDSYSLARDNSYKWTASFLDTQEEATITFDGVSGPLSMSSLRTLEAMSRQDGDGWKTQIGH